MTTGSDALDEYLRVLMNEKDSSPGHKIAMHVWALRTRPDEAREYLDRVLAHAKCADDVAFMVAKKLKDLLPGEVSS